jgi:hypothetical protein
MKVRRLSRLGAGTSGAPLGPAKNAIVAPIIRHAVGCRTMLAPRRPAMLTTIRRPEIGETAGAALCRRRERDPIAPRQGREWVAPTCKSCEYVV